MRLILHRLRALLRHRQVERELDDELSFHIEMETEKNRRDGMVPEEAHRAALRAFGGVEKYREETRDARGVVRLLEDFVADLRYGARTFRKAPGFTAVAVATLALGIGMTTAIFSVVDGVLLRRLPYADAERIVMVWENDRFSGTEREPASGPDFFDFRARSRSFDQLAGISTAAVNLTSQGSEPERLDAAGVSHELLALLGVSPRLGRGFLPAEDQPGAERVAIVSEELWKGRLGGDPDVIGRQIVLNDVAHTIVGVLPATVDIPDPATDVWVPLRIDSESLPRSRHNVVVMGRLKRGVTPAAAHEEMTRIAAELEAEYPRENNGRGVLVEPLSDALLSGSRPALMVLLVAVALVLLIACANVANLLLARGSVRGREVAVRTALGAGGRRLARQFLAENVLLTLTSAALGVALAHLALGRLLALAPAGLPRRDEIGVDLRVLGLTLGVSLVVAFTFGLLPALRSRKLDLRDALTSAAGRGASAARSTVRLRSILMVAEVALSLMLVIGAGLLIRSFRALTRVDPGFQAERVLKVQFQLPATRYPARYDVYPNWPEVHAFHRDALERVRALPGVRAAAIAAYHPLNPGFTNSFVIVGREAAAREQAEVPVRPVSKEYFAALGVPLRSGRLLDDRDRTDAPGVLVVNEEFVRRHLPDGRALGQRIRFWGTEREIVGVVGNERFYGLGEEAPPAVYPPITQTPAASAALLVRGSSDAAALVHSVRGVIREVDPDLALFDIETLEETVAASVGQERFTTLLLGVFAAVALLLAVVGVHGVLSYSVAQRAQEFGVRMALGASARDVVWMVVGQGMRLCALGIALGIAGALAASRLLARLLYGVTATDVATYAVVVAATAAVALLATYLPARRATAAGPMRALRVE